MEVLSIGNSFSQDAQRYLHQIARADGKELRACNLMIGNCSLSIHYRNMLSEEKAYGLEINGDETGFFISLNEALLSRDWDVVTIQQVSSKSPYYDTYQPYLNELIDYIKMCVPKAKIAVHQIWAYPQDSTMLTELLGYKDQKDMFIDVKEAYQKAADEIGADMIIPSGEVFQKLLAGGIEKIHRDACHASYGLGRYALGLLWYKMLTGEDIENNGFSDFDEEVPPQHIEIAKKSVTEVCKSYGK